MKKIRKILLLTALFFPFTSCESNASKNATFEVLESNIQMQRYEEYTIKTNIKNVDESQIKWSSSSLKVCSVKNGVITSLSTGRATITAKYKDSVYTTQVLVLANTTGRVLTVSQSNIVLNLGDETTITSTLKENGEAKDAYIVYESSLPDVISVSSNGVIKALKRGGAIVSAYTVYKGQTFTKDIKVQSVSISSKATSFTLEDKNHTNTSLELVTNNEELGFKGDELVYKYETNGGFTSRLFAENAYVNNSATADRLIFNIKFTEIPKKGTSLYLGYNENKAVKSNENLITSSSALLFYDYKGRIADYVRTSKIYTVVIDLNKNGSGYLKDSSTIYDYGFCFNDKALAYVSSPILCSEDYLYQSLEFEKNEELPALNMKYAETGQGLDLGVEKLPYFDKYWVGYSSGTSEEWADSIWNDRVIIGGLSYSKYRDYEYYLVDIVLTNTDFRNIIIWTGGYSLKLDGNSNVSSSEGQVKENDLYIYQNDTLVPSGTKLNINTAYTFKIRIQKDNLENVAFGISINSATKDPIYFANPTFTNL